MLKTPNHQLQLTPMAHLNLMLGGRMMSKETDLFLASFTASCDKGGDISICCYAM